MVAEENTVQDHDAELYTTLELLCKKLIELYELSPFCKQSLTVNSLCYGVAMLKYSQCMAILYPEETVFPKQEHSFVLHRGTRRGSNFRYINPLCNVCAGAPVSPRLYLHYPADPPHPKKTWSFCGGDREHSTPLSICKTTCTLLHYYLFTFRFRNQHT